MQAVKTSEYSVFIALLALKIPNIRGLRVDGAHLYSQPFEAIWKLNPSYLSSLEQLWVICDPVYDEYDLRRFERFLSLPQLKLQTFENGLLRSFRDLSDFNPNTIPVAKLTFCECSAMASQCLTNLSMTPEIMDGGIKPRIEAEMERFWPGFTDHFVYQGWKGSVLPKMVTDTEFRSSLVFERDGVIYIFPGKISNVVEASDEVFSLLEEGGKNVTRHAGSAYARDSELNRSKTEIEQRPVTKERSTCFLQTQQSLAVRV